MNNNIFLLLFKTTFLLAFCGNITSTFAQDRDLKEIFLNIRNEYEAADQMHIRMVISAFEDKSSGQPFYKETADIKKNKDNYLYSFAENEILLNSKYYLMVDKNAKQIYCSKRPQNNESDLKDPFSVNLDSILNLYGSPEYLGTNGDIDHYTLVQKTGQVKQVDLYIDSQKKYVKTLVYYYQNDQYVSIEFEVFNKQPDFNLRIFDEKKYCAISEGKLKTSPEFQSYKIVDVGI